MFKKVAFEFGQVDYKTARAIFTDANSQRFSIPESLVNKPGISGTMRMDMSGFKLFNDPFGFQLTDDSDPNNVLLTTKDQTFIMQDKYMQMDLILPSQRVFGLGERNREFNLGEGTWTMWANG